MPDCGEELIKLVWGTMNLTMFKTQNIKNVHKKEDIWPEMAEN